MKTGKKPKTIKCIETESGCWNVTNHALVKGYPVKTVNQRQERISRMMILSQGEEIPKGILVCHTCDNPLCINPEHLYLGTPQQNVNDKKNRGRMPDQYGERNPYAKLNKSAIIYIRSSNLSCTKLAKIYNCSVAHISNIKNFKVWTELKE